jgi:hypothetical protein
VIHDLDLLIQACIDPDVPYSLYGSDLMPVVDDLIEAWKAARAELAAVKAENERLAQTLSVATKHYPHMCRMDHEQIGHSSEEERCPVCVSIGQRDAAVGVCRSTLERLDYLRGLWGDEGVTRRVADMLRAVVAQYPEGK